MPAKIKKCPLDREITMWAENSVSNYASAKTPVIRIDKFTGKVRWPKQQWRPGYFFRLVAANGEKLAVSESYTTARARNKTAALLAKAKLVISP